MPYLYVEVSGNPDFGGYMSFDKESMHRVSNSDVAYLRAGQRLIELYSNENFSIGRAELLGNGKPLARKWQLQLLLDRNDMVVINILSKDDEVITAPMHSVYKMSDDELAECDEYFGQTKLND